ncbi:hypothetical protein AMELA_G00177830 [Ameiurus melas]|uniref:Kinesin motor domain-containing protein n=1 Tax=Ameiurus melas TaxID=219545 RepID=A0A7J6A9P2_AMEME|nr:hypothetical protein AMELA_G00177830 [Ameiurus melas]
MGNHGVYMCKCSFLEIYEDKLFDLLGSASGSLVLRGDIKKVAGAVEKNVASAAEAHQGWRKRHTAPTAMNSTSSRSHAIFAMTLESKETREEKMTIRTSRLNLVDLAGTEKQSDTQTEGSRLKEGSRKNLSLMCLGPAYRDSKLTSLLRDSLRGNAKMCFVANVHPGSNHFNETLATLQFVQEAKLIKNKVKPLVVHGILNLQEEDEDMLKYTQKDLDTALEMT